MARATAAIAAAIVGTAFEVSIFTARHGQGGRRQALVFEVENNSNGVVLELRTQEEGEWSENWLANRLEAGDKIKLDFETNEGKCEVRTQIHLADGSYFDAPVDYCKAQTLIIQNGTLLWKWFPSNIFGSTQLKGAGYRPAPSSLPRPLAGRVATYARCDGRRLVRVSRCLLRARSGHSGFPFYKMFL